MQTMNIKRIILNRSSYRTKKSGQLNIDSGLGYGEVDLGKWIEEKIADGDINITSELPSMTGQSGKFLTTNGTVASWATVTSGLSGTLALNQVAVGSGTNTIGGSSNVTFDGATFAITGKLNATGLTSVGDSITASNAIRAFNIASSNGIFRLLRVNATLTNYPTIEIMHRSTADAAENYFWDVAITPTLFSIRDRSAGNTFSTLAIGSSQATIPGSLKLGGTTLSSGGADAMLDVSYIGASSSNYVIKLTSNPISNNVLTIRADGIFVAGTTNTQATGATFTFNSTNGGLCFPRMTTAQRDAISSPANGNVIYNTTTNKLQVRAAAAWVDLH